MVDPSVGAMMGGGADRVCVKDHAGGAASSWSNDIGKNDIGPKTRPRTRLSRFIGSAPQLQDLTILRFWFPRQQLARATPLVKARETMMLRKFLRDENGATAIEYSLIAGFIALAIIAAVRMTGQQLITLFESLIPALTL
jgi:pilus assembly protein Flp/PilA